MLSRCINFVSKVANFNEVGIVEFYWSFIKSS